MDGVQDFPPLGGTHETATEEAQAGLIAELGLWAKRRSPSNVAHRLGISMARVRGLRAGRFVRVSSAALAEMASRAGLKT